MSLRKNTFQSEFEKRKEEDRKENMKLFKSKESAYNSVRGIRVGDWIKDSYTGDISRVTYIWRDELDRIQQIQTGGQKFGSYHLSGKYMSYSGGLDSGYDMKKWKIRNLGYKREGQIWFFKNNFAMANNCVEYMMKMRVFEAY